MAEFFLLRNTSYSQMFGCVILTENHTIVLDGGTMFDDQQMIDFLAENARTHVDAWFFTHPHHDHIGTFVNICKNAPQITVGAMYHHFPELEEIQQYSRTDVEKVLVADFFALIRDKNAHVLSVGDTFVFDDVSVRVLRVYNPAFKENFANNSSTVYRIDGKNGSFLILGDLGVEGGNELMANCPLSLLQTEYTQMAHHGQAGVSKAFYEYIVPKRCIWATSEWLWNNDAGEGFDTGPWYTVRTREWMAELGVTEHIVEKDGIHKITF